MTTGRSFLTLFRGPAAPIGQRLLALAVVTALLCLAIANLRLRASWHEAEDGVLWTKTAEGLVAT